MGVDTNYADQNRLWLIQAELIEPAGYSFVDFAVPNLRSYLQNHAASLVITDDIRPDSTEEH
ncbi:hypothetical protein GCM10011410_29330 [Hoyosella rhizosphaerae]|uniref:Uncharacterized protein n=2 Tax=Hoyosella rhizosphaerae TaxID=1755582 RepID=A0A916UKF8_9ACTN|nr:hypothetical protein GCM10011410_29330 [Hoyosella rhizosphaerae]